MKVPAHKTKIMVHCLATPPSWGQGKTAEQMVIERAMWKHGVQLPASHIVFEDPKAAERFVKVLRDKVELAHGARRAFGVLYEVMNEIEARRTQ